MPVLIGTSRFRSTASFYAKFRARYPAALLDEIARRCDLDGTGRLLDLGCGPAFIAIAMAPHFGEVVGMDPAPEMLEAAAREAAAAHVPIKLIHGSSADLGKHLGRFRMAAMGRSFHWMDRDATLIALDELIEPNGAVAVLGEHHTNAPENSFKPVWDSIIKKWAPEAYEAREIRQRPDWEGHETILRRSAFRRIERLAVMSRREISIDELIGRSHSQSVSSIAALGDNVDAFERELRESLLRIAPTGKLREVVEADAMIARRPL
jgi:ubiquinone/menaquinone biosynthesis C-methylase UbiE